jgi:hypothetical protein
MDFYTIAGRVLPAGRYGSGGEDARLLPLFLGYPEFIRGYGIGSFTAAECTPSATSSCQEFDRLLGSRMLIGNLELRFPLLRPFGVRSGMYGPLPIEVALFTEGVGVQSNTGILKGVQRASGHSGETKMNIKRLLAVGTIVCLAAVAATTTPVFAQRGGGMGQMPMYDTTTETTLKGRSKR